MIVIFLKTMHKILERIPRLCQAAGIPQKDYTDIGSFSLEKSSEIDLNISDEATQQDFVFTFTLTGKLIGAKLMTGFTEYGAVFQELPLGKFQ